jgi:hypothetical protein
VGRVLSSCSFSALNEDNERNRGRRGKRKGRRLSGKKKREEFLAYSFKRLRVEKRYAEFEIKRKSSG